MFLQLLAIGQSKASTKRKFNSVSTVQHLFMNYFIVSQGYSQKNTVEECSLLPKTKICDFSYPI